jgi:hypothetical protein
MTSPLYGPYGSAAIDYAAQLAAYNVNAVWFHGFNSAAFTACAQHGLAACVEFKTFRADFNERPELIPTGADGQPIRYGRLVQGVCLSQTEFLAETEAALLAGLQTYQPHGIWLDYLTYAGWFETPTPDLQESCFCPACIADFCEATGIDATTSTQILHHHPLSWQRYKCERVAKFAAHYANLIRSHLPDCLIGAYMCPWTPGEYENALSRIFAQDYTLLAPAIDIFTPLIYAQKSGRPAEWGRTWLKAAPTFVPADRQVQLILDALDFPASLLALADSSSDQVRPSWGLQLFGGAQVFADPAQAQIFAEAVGRMQ